MIRKFLILFLLLILIGLTIFIWKRFESPPADELPIFGNIEVTQVDVSFKIPGKVLKRVVDEGDLVQEGQLIAYLDKRELFDEVEVRRSRVTQTESSLSELAIGNIPRDIVQAEAVLEQAEAEFSRVERDFERQQSLLSDHVISQREFDVSFANFLSTKAQLTQARESLDLLKKGISQEKIRQSEAQVEEAKKQLAIAETRLNDATLLSPLSGWVLTKNIESGEVVSSGTPIVTIGNLRDIWFRAYVDETDLGKVKLGQNVTISNDSYPNKVYKGKVSFISQEAEFTPKNVETKKERVKLVYRIKVTLDNPNDELKPGMPAEGVIHLNQNA